MAVSLFSCTAVSLFSCTAVSLFSFTDVSLFSCMIASLFFPCTYVSLFFFYVRTCHFFPCTSVSLFHVRPCHVVCTHIQPFWLWNLLPYKVQVSLLATCYQFYMQRCASPVSGSTRFFVHTPSRSGLRRQLRHLLLQLRELHLRAHCTDAGTCLWRRLRFRSRLQLRLGQNCSGRSGSGNVRTLECGLS